MALEDPLLRIFAGDRINRIMVMLKMPEGEAIEHSMVTRSIESAQRKVEARNFDIRKQLLEYDDVSNDQRKVIYQQRNEILESTSVVEQITNLRASAMTEVVRTYVPAESVEEQWDLAGLEKVLKDEWQLDVDLRTEVEQSDTISDEDVVAKVVQAADAMFAGKVAQVGEEQFNPFMRMVLLQSIDSHWREHLAALDYLRQGIHLRGYAQKNPKQEYKREAFDLFSTMLEEIKAEVTRILMMVQIRSEQQVEEVAEAPRPPVNVQYHHAAYEEALGEDGEREDRQEKHQPFVRPGGKVGRNDPCPCGSGKKYKQCHGKLN